MVKNEGDEGREEGDSYWLSNSNFRIRDFQIKESFIMTEQRMEHNAKIDAMLSGTTCVTVFFNHDMILCANSGDSRAILVSENETRQAHSD